MKHVFEWLDNLDPMTVALAIGFVLVFLYGIERRRR
jgi:hypothetical protein